jgi:uncharacterized protein YfiM (DUF2279 family)
MKKTVLNTLLGLGALAILSSCGGGGGGSSSHHGGGGTIDILKYPYETVFGSECVGYEPTPGCTFSTDTGLRITVSEDPHYDRSGFGSDDMQFVEFDSSGRAYIYDEYGDFVRSADVSDFAGHIGGTTIGVGSTGFFWENVANGTYWFGKNGVLYNANSGESNFGEAINNKNSGKATNTNIIALKSKANTNLINKAAAKLVKNYEFSQEKAVAVASALNSWAVLGAERGKVTTSDMSKTFKAVFGVQFNDALAAVKGLQVGKLDGMKDVTNRSAASLGLKPHQAQEFIKDMYKDALKNYGYDAKDINWMD